MQKEMENEEKKGASQGAKDYAQEVTRRFTEFVKGKGMKEVSDHVRCNYQALRNSVSEGHNPSLVTLCQVILGYPDELDVNYLFTGKRSQSIESVEGDSEFVAQIESLKNKLSVLQERVGEKDDLISALKQDKIHLQNHQQFLVDMIRKPSVVE